MCEKPGRNKNPVVQTLKSPVAMLQPAPPAPSARRRLLRHPRRRLAGPASSPRAHVLLFSPLPTCLLSTDPCLPGPPTAQKMRAQLSSLPGGVARDPARAAILLRCEASVRRGEGRGTHPRRAALGAVPLLLLLAPLPQCFRAAASVSSSCGAPPAPPLPVMAASCSGLPGGPRCHGGRATTSWSAGSCWTRMAASSTR